MELCLSVREFVLVINNDRASAQLEHLQNAARLRGFYHSSWSCYSTSTAASLTGYSRLVPGILSDGNVLYLRPSEKDQIPQYDY